MQFNDLTIEYRQQRREIDRAMAAVFARGQFILGPEVEKFEREFAGYLGAAHAVGVNSGTDALFLALRGLGVGAGDEVITVAHTAAPTAAAIVMTGARPVYADITAGDMTIDPGDVAKKITRKTRAIVPVHLYGYPCDLRAIMKIAKQHGLKVVEDACQAHGAEYAGRKAGTIGDAGCFSFYPTKNLGGYGDGGMVVTGSRKLAGALLALRQYGWTRDRKNFVAAGVNSRLAELQAAILRVKLRRLDAGNRGRRAIAALYDRELAGSPVILPREEHPRRHAYHLYVIRTQERARLRKYLLARGVPTMIHYPHCLHRSGAYGGRKSKLPVTDRAAQEILSLPMYAGLPPAAARRVAAGIMKFYGCGK
ncbi:MAG: hypothetical protein A2107_08060 [Verrucomicrobia bacterium GWF2_62_7]|nr:MAG: hypothetical protein A2107_08060 [Verrucomicrobia bacterium GWF2_62_7]